MRGQCKKILENAPHTKVQKVQSNSDTTSNKDNTSSTSDEDYMYVMCTLKHPTQPFIKININDTPIDVIVDSGASVNLIDDIA